MMTGTLVAMTSPSEEQEVQQRIEGQERAGDGESPVVDPAADPPVLSHADREVVRGLVARARADGTDLTGPDVLLKFMTKAVLEAALAEEMVDHLGYDKHDPIGRNRGNSRNGYRSKTVMIDAVGEVEIDVPRDRDGTFEPQIVGKRQRRLTDLDQMVISLYAKGLTTGEISAHLEEVYGASVSKDTISRITDKVIDEMNTWWAR
ncbi:MAG: transposase, partial [Propioniciclava sp.]